MVLIGTLLGQPGSGWDASRRIADELDAVYGPELLARFSRINGVYYAAGEVQGLLVPSSDPLRAMLAVAAMPDVPHVRWTITYGTVQQPDGRESLYQNGPAYWAARRAEQRDRRSPMDSDALVALVIDGQTEAQLEWDLSALSSYLCLLSASQRTALAQYSGEDGVTGTRLAAADHQLRTIEWLCDNLRPRLEAAVTAWLRRSAT